jgi:hypothetical protein
MIIDNIKGKIMKTSKDLLLAAGILSLALAVFQAVISLSPSWSLYFGAPAKLTANITALYVTGEIAAVLFAIFGLYAFSGAGVIRKLPLMRTILTAITGVYLFRGTLVIPQMLASFNIIDMDGEIPIRMIIFSAVSLIIGIIYLFGVIGYWKKLGTKSE